MVKRVVYIEDHEKIVIDIRRFKCLKCNKVHREIPDSIYPYKLYSKEIINMVLNDEIDSDTFGYEDFPSEITMMRWKKFFNL